MIAAGVNAKALSSFIGHSSIKVTFDLYGHLMPGAGKQAVALIDRFLADAAEEDWASVGRQAPPAQPSYDRNCVGPR